MFGKMTTYVVDRIQTCQKERHAKNTMRGHNVLKQIYRSLMKSSCDPHSPPIVVVIDGLDECGCQEDIRLLLQLLRDVQDLRTV